MSTDSKTIESYNKNAHLWVGKMRSGKNYAHRFIEKPAMSDLINSISNLSAKKILALGCGSGEEIELLLQKGARPENIIGIDISEKLIEFAENLYPEVELHVMDAENLDFADESFDIVYSSLVLHYLEDWGKALSEIHRVLKKGGEFIFSVHHPLIWSVGDIYGEGFVDKVIGYRKNLENRDEVLLHGTYLTPTNAEGSWFNGALKFKYFNKSISQMFDYIKNNGFIIQNLKEPRILDEAKHYDKKLWLVHKEIPMFLIWKCTK
jgi:ubiquinone/menaquinone biosynthesis C-methylase UbiE